MDPLEQDVRRILLSLGPLPPPRPRPALVILCGVPGSGKSTVAHALAGRAAVALVQSDQVRKLLVAVPQYTTEESARVFGALHVAVERLLRAGISAIVDATNLQEQHRAPLRVIAARCGARWRVVVVTASERSIRQRLRARSAGQREAFDVSDAGEAVYELLRARVEPVRGPHMVIDTEQDMSPAIAALAGWLEDGISPAHSPQRPAKAQHGPAAPDGRGEGDQR